MKQSNGIRDPRLLETGYVIHSGGYYVDEPHVVCARDGSWICTVSAGDAEEGSDPGQRSLCRRSFDCGRSWSDPIGLEPPGGPEGSKASLIVASSGRVFAFYTHNTDNLREVLADDGRMFSRVDSLGYFVFRFSDDDGLTWSDRRYTIPVRETAIDRANPYGGSIRFFWNSAATFAHDGKVYVPLTKVGGFGAGTFTRSEGVLLESANLLRVDDPARAEWITLPDGEVGLRAPHGPIAEEHSYCVLSDGSFYVTYRTVDGSPACSYSRDLGRSWEPPRPVTFADGRCLKHPRAAGFVWRCGNGRYLYWHHNHGGAHLRNRGPDKPYEDRNPAWLSAGRERDSPEGKRLEWSEPEVVLYDDDPFVRISYPAMIEAEGELFLTESNKEMARVHHVDADLLAGLWTQSERADVCRDGLVLEVEPRDREMDCPMPRLPDFLVRDRTRRDHGTKDNRAGVTIEIWIDGAVSGRPGVLLDNRDADGTGFVVATTPEATVEIALDDGRTRAAWACDPERLDTPARHHLVIGIDGGPKIITFVVDGRLHDGGPHRQFGWGRYSPNLRGVNGSASLRITRTEDLSVMMVRVYGRCLRTSEAISNWRAGLT